MTSDHDQHGALKSSITQNVNPEVYYQDIWQLVPTSPGAIIVDIGGSDCRDAVAMHNKANGLSRVFNLEPDFDRYIDALHIHGATVQRVNFASDYTLTYPSRQAIVLPSRFPDTTLLDEITMGAKIDFMLCNAVLMFIKPECRRDFLAAIKNTLKPQGVCVLRFRTEDLKINKGMFDITTNEIDGHLSSIYGTDYQITPSIPDPVGRSFAWHQRIITPKL